jgi:hypothetical protein
MNMKRFMNKKVAAIGLAAGLALGAAGAAFAYWTANGQGSGTASTGTTTPWAVVVTSDVSNSLTPGGPTETIAYTVTNNSTGKQELNQVAIQVAGSTGTSPNATSVPWSSALYNASLPVCNANDFQLSNAGGTAAAGAVYTESSTNTPALPDELAAGGVYTGSVTIQLVDATDAAPINGGGNQDNCESVSPPLFVAAS